MLPRLAACLALPISCAALAQQPAPPAPIGPAPVTGNPAPAAAPTPEPAARDNPPADAKKLEKIEVQAEGATTERRQSTASKIIVNSDEIQKYGDSNAFEVLKRLPGVTIGGGGGRGADVRMRGLGSGYTQILINGEPPPPGLTLDTISPDMIERIEIIRSATAEFSTQAVAGTINIVLRRVASQKKNEVRLAANTENGEWGGNASWLLSDKSGILSWAVNANASRFGFRNDSTSEQVTLGPAGTLLQAYTSTPAGKGHGYNANLAPRLNWAFDKGHTLSWDTFALRGNFGGTFRDAYTLVAGALPPYEQSASTSESEYYTLRTNLAWSKRFPDGNRAEAKAGATYTERQYRGRFSADGFGGERVLDRLSVNSSDDTGFTSTGKYSVAAIAGHSWVSGWDLAWSQRDETRVQEEIRPPAPRTTIDESFAAKVTRAAFFSQDEWEITPRLSTYLGLRWEGIETRSEGDKFAAVTSRTSVWSPIAQTLWKLPGSEKDQVRAAIARTYKAPDTGQLIPRRYFSPNNTPSTPDYSGNPNLKPELSWGLDLAYEHYPAGGGNASISVYRRRLSDIVVRETILEDGVYISRPGNRGGAVSQGIELDAKGTLRQLIAGAPAIDLRGNLSYGDSKVDYIPGPDNRLASQTRLSGTVGIDYKIIPDKYTVGSSFSFKTGGFNRIAPNQATYTSALRQLEAYFLWRFTPKVQLRLAAYELLAQDYLDVSTYSDASGLQQRTTINPRFRRFAANLELKL